MSRISSQSEEEFLSSYDESAYARPSVTVDLALMTVVDGAPAALLRRREEHPFKGQWALPGSFVGVDEALDEAALRVLADEAHMSGAFIEQLYTFGDPGRDPRTRVITVAYFALLPAESFREALKQGTDLVLAELVVAPEDDRASVSALNEEEPLPLAFDHADILHVAVARLRGKLDYSPVAFALLPREFTLRQLQDVHEAILGKHLNKPAFRRRMLDKGWIKGTGRRETNVSFRPAELYSFNDLQGE
jgi:8-oxo-dGTP diphosphatase